MRLNKVPFAELLLAVSFGLAVFNCAAAPTEAKTTKASAKTMVASAVDEADIRSQISSLASYLASGDEKSLAALWAPDGVYIDDAGNVVKGRAAVEKRFSTLFQTAGKQFYELTPESVTILSKSVAQSAGTSRRKEGVATLPETRYLMVFVKQNGNWLISSAVETPITQPEISNQDRLSDLAWLIGEWRTGREGASVRMKADWAANKNFILCKYEIAKPNQPLHVDMQVIGWDPTKDAIVSWLFDSSGGTGHGRWSRKDRAWVVESSGVERDGSRSSAVNIIDPTDPNTFLWQSLNRTIDGVALGDTAPLKIQRVIQ